MFSWSSSENIGLDKEALKGLLVEGVGGLISPCILQSWYGMISVVCKIFFETKLCHWLWSRASQLCPLAVGNHAYLTHEELKRQTHSCVLGALSFSVCSFLEQLVI